MKGLKHKNTSNRTKYTDDTDTDKDENNKGGNIWWNGRNNIPQEFPNITELRKH